LDAGQVLAAGGKGGDDLLELVRLGAVLGVVDDEVFAASESETDVALGLVLGPPSGMRMILTTSGGAAAFAAAIVSGSSASRSRRISSFSRG
jgi:hypothetical protein